MIAAASEPELRTDFDDVVGVVFPERFVAWGSGTTGFAPTSDEEVLECLARGRPGPRAGGRDGERLGSGSRSSG